MEEQRFKNTKDTLEKEQKKKKELVLADMKVYYKVL